MTEQILNPDEVHPAGNASMAYLDGLGPEKLCAYQKIFAQLAGEGSRAAEICVLTLDRLLSGQAVSDRLALGLAWVIKGMEDQQRDKPSKKTDVHLDAGKAEAKEEAKDPHWTRRVLLPLRFKSKRHA